MPNKKSSRNAYFYFALDMIPVLKRRGFEVSGVRDAISLCSGDWALLTVEEKEKYALKAKQWRSQEPKPPATKDVYVCLGQGRSTSLAAKVTEVLAQHTGDVARHEMALVKKTEGLEKKVFHFINIFSHGEMPAQCDQRFLPCEIGCVRYSLQEGILGSFHEFIDPGEIPLGCRYHCQAGSASTHQIPVSGFNLANGDYHNLFRSLYDFVCPVHSVTLQVYCRRRDLYRVRWCLQWLAYKAGIDNRFELMEAESVIIKYYRDKLDEEPSKSSVDRLLDVFYWDYASNTRCKWHEENDMSCCALASCKKITALASVYGVTLTSAHLPTVKGKQSKPIILDGRRYQENPDRLHFKGISDSRVAAPGTSNWGTGGAGSAMPGRGRGREIVRLLSEMAARPPNSGSTLAAESTDHQHFKEPLDSPVAAVGTSDVGMGGAAPVTPGRGRGREILRLLSEMAARSPNTESPRGAV